MMQENLPRHIAIIMDGNGRWAKKRNLPRIAGHREGVESIRAVIDVCEKKKIEVLTVWAFGTENWSRPTKEVRFLMNLFFNRIGKEIDGLHKRNVQFRMIGDIDQLGEQLQGKIQKCVALTANNTGLKFIIAFNYGGHWDITQAVRKVADEVKRGVLHASAITSDHIKQHLSVADLPDPDFLIRTSGEQRLSNFMLWQLAYTELYFTDILWPDFREKELDAALEVYVQRERRYGGLRSQNTEPQNL